MNPAEVEDRLLEDLGETVLTLVIADESRHTWMDKIMGGKNSGTLRAMHRIIGYRYLLNDTTWEETKLWEAGENQKLAARVSSQNLGAFDLWGIRYWVLTGILGVAVIFLSAALFLVAHGKVNLTGIITDTNKP